MPSGKRGWLGNPQEINVDGTVSYTYRMDFSIATFYYQRVPPVVLYRLPLCFLVNQGLYHRTKWAIQINSLQTC